jgi:hypothetical protein
VALGGGGGSYERVTPAMVVGGQYTAAVSVRKPVRLSRGVRMTSHVCVNLIKLAFPPLASVAAGGNVI